MEPTRVKSNRSRLLRHIATNLQCPRLIIPNPHRPILRARHQQLLPYARIQPRNRLLMKTANHIIKLRLLIRPVQRHIHPQQLIILRLNKQRLVRLQTHRLNRIHILQHRLLLLQFHHKLLSFRVRVLLVVLPLINDDLALLWPYDKPLRVRDYTRDVRLIDRTLAYVSEEFARILKEHYLAILSAHEQSASVKHPRVARVLGAYFAVFIVHLRVVCHEFA